MDDSIFINNKSELKLEDRKKLSITGVIEVINFNEEKINLNTVLGVLQVIGEDLKINKIDVTNGDVIISGKIKSTNYKTVMKKKKKISLLAKVLKRG